MYQLNPTMRFYDGFAAEHASQYPGALARIANSGFEAMIVDDTPRTTQQLANTINRADRLERNLRLRNSTMRRDYSTNEFDENRLIVSYPLNIL